MSCSTNAILSYSKTQITNCCTHTNKQYFVRTGWSPSEGHDYKSMAIIRLLSDINHQALNNLILVGIVGITMVGTILAGIILAGII